MTVLLSILFAGVALFAVAAMVLAARQFGPMIRDLRDALADVPETQTLRTSVIAQGISSARKRRSRHARLNDRGVHHRPALRTAA